MDTILDLKSRESRLKNYKPKRLRLARGIIVIALFVILLMVVALVLQLQANENLNYQLAHAFNPIH